jgi:hypothetical protein
VGRQEDHGRAAAGDDADDAALLAECGEHGRAAPGVPRRERRGRASRQRRRRTTGGIWTWSPAMAEGRGGQRAKTAAAIAERVTLQPTAVSLLAAAHARWRRRWALPAREQRHVSRRGHITRPATSYGPEVKKAPTNAAGLCSSVLRPGFPSTGAESAWRRTAVCRAPWSRAGCLRRSATSDARDTRSR